MLRLYRVGKDIRKQIALGALVLLSARGSVGQVATQSPATAPVADLRRAEALFQAGKTDEAMARVAAVTGRFAQDPAVRFTAGLVLSSAGQFGPAAREFETVTHLRPNYEAYYNLGLCYSHLGRWLNARAAYFQALEQDLHAYEPNLRLALDGLQQNKPYLAIPWLLKCLRLRPHNPEALYLLGEAYLREEYFESSEAVFQELVKLRPQDPRAHAGLGDAEAKLDRYSAALAEYQQAANLAPRAPDLQYDLGKVEERLQRPADAVAHFKRSLELNPNYALALAALGEEAGEAGQYSEAVSNLRRSLELDPENEEAQFALSKALAHEKGFDEAIRILQSLAAAHPADRRLHYQLARVLTDAGRRGQGEAEMETFEHLEAQQRGKPHLQHPRKYID